MNVPMCLNRLRAIAPLRAWRRDTRGSSMVTTALTLPLFIVILMGIWWLGLFLYVKWTLRQATVDAAQYISENARTWNINPDAEGPGELLPEDWYDYQGKRIVWSRLSDLLAYNEQEISATLQVTVTEPALAVGTVDQKPVCDPGAREPGDYRDWSEAGFLVYADFNVPVWRVRIPWETDHFDMAIRLRDRAVGHIQCPRWQGKGNVDKSIEYGSEGPPLPFRRPVTAVPTPPSVTPAPSPTPETPTPTPTNTPNP
jgi:hypothetical protein